MPKLLYFVTEDWFFVSHFLPMARTAQDCGYQVAIATRLGNEGERLKANGLAVIPIENARGSFSLFMIVREFAQLFKILRAERADVVHCISLRPIVIGGLAARLAGAKTLILAPTGLGHLWLDQGTLARFLRKIVSFVIGSLLRRPGTHYLFENSDDPGEFGLDPNSADVTIVGGSGVDPSRIPPAPDPPQPPVKVAVVSRMIEFKGIGEAVQAVQRARAAGAPIELHLFGDPDPANPRSIPIATLQRWAQQPGIAWHGRVADVATVWRDHHIAMLLSRREGLPRSLVEAAAAGRPIVTADVAGCREVVRNGVEGILVPLGDIDAAARALATLAADPHLRVRMGAAAHGRFRERFTAGAVIQTVGKLYGSLGPHSDVAD